TELVSNGKADWVYYEEVFDRKHRAYWWSPDSQYVAFLRFDDKPVPPFPIADLSRTSPATESTRYPKAGDANPLVRRGVAPVGGGEVRWVDLRSYPEKEFLIIRAGWTPDSRQVYFYVQDRAQTWLDVCLAPYEGGPATRLLRDKTDGWVEDPGEPAF